MEEEGRRGFWNRIGPTQTRDGGRRTEPGERPISEMVKNICITDSREVKQKGPLCPKIICSEIMGCSHGLGALRGWKEVPPSLVLENLRAEAVTLKKKRQGWDGGERFSNAPVFSERLDVAGDAEINTFRSLW